MIVVPCKQNTAEWWEARRGVPTASECSSIITPVKEQFSEAGAKTYACQLIADTFDGDYGHLEEYVSVAMRNGILMEPEARRFYEYERGCEVQQVGFITTDDGRFGASPDSLIAEDGGLELKSPAPKTIVRWLIDGKLPDEHKCQVHGCLAISGRAYWDFLAYTPGFPRLLLRVEPDEFTSKLKAALEKFWPIYQGLLAQVAGDREQAISADIDRKGDQLPADARSLVPACSQVLDELMGAFGVK